MQQQNYKPLQIKKFAKKAISDTPENKYWKKFKVFIYNSIKDKIKFEFDKFKDKVTGLTLRQDAQLIATAESNGIIRVFDIKRKHQLREFNFHKKPVYALDFVKGESLLFSGSDDYNVKLFDVAANSIIRTLPEAHTDYIRSISYIPNTDKNILTSSYDGSIHLFDFNDKSKKPQLQFNHELPVEEITISPSGFSFCSVGGTNTNIWDIRNGKSIEQMNNNQKTVTSARYIGNGDRLMVGSVDQSMKIYRTDTYSLTHQFKLPNPILSFDMSLNTKCFLVGMSDGSLEIRSNLKKLGEQINSEDEEDENKELTNEFIPDFLRKTGVERRVQSYKYFNRGIYEKQQQFDVKYEEKKNKKVNQYDKYLKKFQYKTAMLKAIESKQNDVVIALYEELLQRGEVSNAFKNLDQHKRCFSQ
ncbi:U3 small nucleolar protein, putative [Ichthyophthirius multifiliis]|uniref:U3 small nucleolar protein, putative n=1 Tax=Ichthyophthirius multifiliis TaxID=5932 RepID=G0R3I0_ICHMU|nr:U3 small nucleolar protein, putative [Ichthyophthirius multifiliis]EGR27969.1 U3 small nucleolar protein, putative [Ichthyophthirius multifiliis]|eukprot:XP_004027314.1 U3 small nucleolar protein, putative [Ichthyophthirius multifiliis]